MTNPVNCQYRTLTSSSRTSSLWPWIKCWKSSFKLTPPPSAFCWDLNIKSRYRKLLVRISTDVALTFPFNPSKHMIVFEVTNGYNVSDFCTVTETKSTTLIPATATKSAILELAKDTKSVILAPVKRQSVECF